MIEILKFIVNNTIVVPTQACNENFGNIFGRNLIKRILRNEFSACLKKNFQFNEYFKNLPKFLQYNFSLMWEILQSSQVNLFVLSVFLKKNSKVIVHCNISSNKNSLSNFCTLSTQNLRQWRDSWRRISL